MGVCAGVGADGARGGRQRALAGRGVLQPRQSAGRAEHRSSGRRRAEVGVNVGPEPSGRVWARAKARRRLGARARRGVEEEPRTGLERRADRLVQIMRTTCVAYTPSRIHIYLFINHTVTFARFTISYDKVNTIITKHDIFKNKIIKYDFFANENYASYLCYLMGKDSHSVIS